MYTQTPFVRTFDSRAVLAHFRRATQRLFHRRIEALPALGVGDYCHWPFTLPELAPSAPSATDTSGEAAPGQTPVTAAAALGISAFAQAGATGTQVAGEHPAGGPVEQAGNVVDAKAVLADARPGRFDAFPAVGQFKLQT